MNRILLFSFLLFYLTITQYFNTLGQIKTDSVGEKFKGRSSKLPGFAETPTLISATIVLNH